MQKFKIINKLIILLFPVLGYSQINIDLSYNGYLDDNLYRTPLPIQDYLSNYIVGTSYNFDESGVILTDNFSLVNYKDNSDRNFLINNLGISKHIKIGQNQFSNLYMGGNWNFRINQDDHDYYNYNQISGYANFQLFTNLILLKGGYNYRWRNYTNWPELSNHLHNAFIQLNKSFPTKTTFIFETAFGVKTFYGTDSFATVAETGRGNGRWSGSSIIENSVNKSLNTSQLRLYLRVTQSLANNLGLYVQYSKQFSLDDEVSYRNFSDYYQDDELFDDPFTYESDNCSGRLTWILPKSTKLMIGGSYEDKSYINETIYINETDFSDTGEIRNDSQLGFYADISKTFSIKDLWLNSIKLNLYYSYTDNESNSYWYNYNNSSLGGGIQLNF